MKVSSLSERLGILRAMSISQLVHECSELFRSKEEQILSGDFDQALTGTIPSSAILDQISTLSVRDIYRSRQVLEREAGGYEIISKLMEAFCTASYETLYAKASPKSQSVYRLLPNEFRILLESTPQDVYGTLMLVTDYVSSLTDRYAMRLYRILYGL